MDFRDLTIVRLAEMIQQGEISAREVVTHALDRNEARPELNAFVAVDGERALAEADEIDTARAKGDDLPPLAGIPIGVKDLEDAEGFVTTYGSVLSRDDPPATSDSILVDRLRQAGCIVIGKTNTPEHGWKGDTHNNLFGGTTNPWNPSRSAGGSSGGSASAVAAGLVPLATASDGGGSIRIPAALCGLPGFKPSMGRIPMGGPDPAGWPDLSVKGVLTDNVRDAALVLDAVIGPDPSDQQSLPMPERSWIDHLSDVHLPKRVVWSPTLGYASVDAEVLDTCEAAIAVLEAAGTEVVVIDDVFDRDPVDAFLVLSGVANLRTLAPFRDHPDWEQVDEELRGVLGVAESLTAVDFVKHRDTGHLLNCRLIEVLHAGSFLLTPTVAGQAGPPGGLGTIDGEDAVNWVQMTYPFNLSRSPAGTVPVGLSSDGMPIGLQVVGPQHADVGVLRFMAALEDLIDFSARPAR
jgi:Asp-tRNA(Asn)/Glu-tRNA(Gln) amidotransferase A subunit family amidase